MELNERSFSGQSLRPTPAIKCTPYFVAVVTPWNGSQKDASEVISSFQESYSYLSADSDRTQPFQKLNSLSDNENNLRTVCYQLNRDIFSKHNQKEITLGFEAFFGVRSGKEFIFLQIGHPQVFLLKQSKGSLQNIGQNQIVSTSKDNTYLPYNLIGIFSDIQLSIQSIQIEKGDQLILLGGRGSSVDFLNSSNGSVNDLGQILSQDSDRESFWLGQINF